VEQKKFRRNAAIAKKRKPTHRRSVLFVESAAMDGRF
jgi:hypothetical protein